jgi:serine/threonine-protein kinase
MAETPTILAQSPVSDASSTSGFGGLSPDVREDISRRFAGVALLYAGVYVVAFLADLLLEAGELERTDAVDFAKFLLSVALGLATFFFVRRTKLSGAALVRLAIAFQILAGLGIIVGVWGWEGRTAEYVQALVDRGLDLDRVLADGLPLFIVDGVPYLGLWIVMFPLIVPMRTLYNLTGSIATALTFHVVAYGSQLAHGVPELAAPWAGQLWISYTVSLGVCIGIAWYGSRVIYRLTRDLSKAREMGSYRLVEKLGAGGMGEVWRAQHRMLARPAAVKLIRADAVGGLDVTRRFEREAQATAGLESPHTVELYDFGVTDEGTFYYVMELLDGLDLDTLVEKYGPVPAARAVHFLKQACHSLTDAHETGLVHRDIKPANLITCRRAQDFDFLKVLDFGLVKQFDESTAAETKLTREGVASGTPAFMAPEMVYGAEDVDARADIYALGCVAYWLVTGQMVFEGRTPMEVLVSHAKDEPVPPSARTELEVPATLEALILDCLRKKADERPASARELRKRLGSAEAETGTWSEEAAARWWQTHRPAVGV